MKLTYFTLRLFTYIILLSCYASSYAQEVPSAMMLGDLQLKINEATRKQIQKDVDRLTQSQTYYNILVDRMNLYFPIIEREHGKANIPDQIKFLAIQESALISDAVSSANAVGFWQFKDFTAREVGLRVDRAVDERLNIVSSSRGSAKYLNSHNFFLKNWQNSVMAYNTGRGGAQKYISDSDYNTRQMTINSKTHWYVKKFIAHIVAFTPSVGRPHSEGIWLDEITDAGGKTLQQIAKEENIALEELKTYNKWLKRGAVPTDKTYAVLIPRQGTRPDTPVATKNPTGNTPAPDVKILPTELKKGISKPGSYTKIPLNGLSTVLARPTDDIHSLSARSGISEKKFRTYNDLDADSKIEAGQFYYIKKKKGKAKVAIHVVEPGETLWSISQTYGIRLQSLAKKNRMSIIDALKPGRVLWMDKTRPKKEPIAFHTIEKSMATTPGTQPDVASKPIDEINKSEESEAPDILVPKVDTKEERLKKVKIHTIASGETLWSISRLYEVKVSDLLRWNDLPNPDAVSIGQNIQVKAPIEESSVGKTIIQHAVKPGETVYGISRKYSMTVDEVVELNELEGFELNVGQLLKVYDGEQ